jgi:hypothetical protein
LVNSVNAIPSNSMYGVYLNDVSLGAQLVGWFHTPEGQRSLRSQTKQYSGGLFKLEPGGLSSVRVPRPELLAVNGNGKHPKRSR